MRILQAHRHTGRRRREARTSAAARPAGSPGAPLIILALILCQVAIGALVFPVAEEPDRLATEIDAVLADEGLGGAEVGVSVVAPASGRVLYARNNMARLIVASNQKIVTAAVALRELGPGYEFETSLFASTPLSVSEGVFDGDLILRGGADPTLGSPSAGEEPLEEFERWAELLRSDGVQRVSGDMVVDDTFLDRRHVHPDWPRVQLYHPYCAPVSALSLNDNCVTVSVKPGANVGDPAVVALTPAPRFLKVANRCTTSSKQQTIWFTRAPDSLIIEVGGQVKHKSGGYSGQVTVPEPALFAGDVFAGVLKRSGIEVAGKVRLAAGADLERRSQWQRLASRRTPLVGVLEIMLKQSNNVYAEHVIKTVGAVKGGRGSWGAGLARAEAMLKELHFNADEFELADGSGMSRNNRLPSSLICAVLVAMDRSESGDTFRVLLPSSGTDGSLARRLSDPDYRDRVHAKTGYLRGVGALSGYAETRSGIRVAFSILINNFKGEGGNRTMKDIENRIAKAIVDNG